MNSDWQNFLVQSATGLVHQQECHMAQRGKVTKFEWPWPDGYWPEDPASALWARGVRACNKCVPFGKKLI